MIRILDLVQKEGDDLFPQEMKLNPIGADYSRIQTVMDGTNGVGWMVGQ